MAYFLYLLENMVNGKIYIGQTINPPSRYSEHKHSAKKKENKPLYNAINKYGLDKFMFTIFQVVDTELEADECEKYWIDLLQSNINEFGYNLDGGGRGKYKKVNTTKFNPRHTGYKHSEETRAQMSSSHKGEKKPEGWKVARKNRIGEQAPNTKLTATDVLAIRQEVENGAKRKFLAQKYNVNKSTIDNIINRKSWGNV